MILSIVNDYYALSFNQEIFFSIDAFAALLSWAKESTLNKGLSEGVLVEMEEHSPNKDTNGESNSKSERSDETSTS